MLGLWLGPTGGEGAEYPAMIRSWENFWAEFVPFLEFPAQLRKLCTRPTPSSR